MNIGMTYKGHYANVWTWNIHGTLWHCLHMKHTWDIMLWFGDEAIFDRSNINLIAGIDMHIPCQAIITYITVALFHILFYRDRRVLLLWHVIKDHVILSQIVIRCVTELLFSITGQLQFRNFCTPKQNPQSTKQHFPALDKSQSQYQSFNNLVTHAHASYICIYKI